MATTEQPHTPAVTVTPASPTTPTSSTSTAQLAPPLPTTLTGAMKEKTSTDSETALVAKGPVASMSTSTERTAEGSSAGTTGRVSPLETLTRRLSGKAAPTTASVSQDHAGVDAPSAKQHEKPATSQLSTTSPQPTSAVPAASTSRSQPASTPASAPAQRSMGASTQKKKKKRKGLAGLLVTLGCLSADEIDDDPKQQQARRDMSQKPGGGVTKPTAAPAAQAETTKPAVASTPTPAEPAPTAPTASAPETVPTQTSDAAATTSTEAPVQPRSETIPAVPAAVVVAPVEPVHIPEDETAGVTSSAVQPPGSGSELLSTPARPSAVRRESDTPSQYAAEPSSSADPSKNETGGEYTDISESDIPATDEGEHVDEHDYEDEYEDEEDRLIAQGGMGIPLDENGHPAPLLPPMDKAHHGRKCLVLDLDETLLHSSFKMLPSADYIVPVEIESQVHNVYVIKRPGVDHFLTEMGKIYEVVIFTASLSKYADPVLDMLDPTGVVRHRLFRESCYNHKGNYVKDLSQLGRDMEGCIIIDNSPASYIFHPNNAVPVSTWFNDPHDTELTDLCPFLTDLATVDDIRGVLDGTV